jgi:anti-sigma regulatory factor (Ser/Thr protein kinase)
MPQETITISTQRDYFKLYDLIAKRKVQDVALEIRKSFFEPFDVLVFTGFIIHQLHLRNRTSIYATNPLTNDYIREIGLIDFYTGNYHKSKTIQSIPKYTAMPIKRLDRERMQEYINATQLYFQNFCAGKDLGMLNVVLAELLNNAYDHAHSDLGAYVFCQYYPNLRVIKLAVADFGIGIPHSVNNYRLGEKETSLPDIDCVKWAIKENKTTKSIPQNMGKGLDLLKTFLKTSNNHWVLYSDKVKMKAAPWGNRYEQNPIAHFKGTIAQIKIRIDSLQPLEFESDFDW